MGLLGYLLLSLLEGLDLWLLRPTTFLARPRRWLEELSRHQAAVGHGPNFGYQLCVERLDAEARAGLDLSGWRAAQTGAEMIRPQTIQGFLEAFTPCGFRPESLQASYGLAEATLAVTIDRRGQGVRWRPLPAAAMANPGDSGEVVSLGEPMLDTEVRIRAPGGRLLEEGEIGEVEVRSPGIFAGYYGDPEATAETLVDGWLRTGDLGFLDDGELYLSGRLKELLIVRGHNLMPHEIEWLAESVTGGGGTLRCGAFAVTRGGQGEEAVVVAEVQEKDPEKLAELDREIRLQVAHNLSLQISDLVMVKRGKIPKTTSGKVRRRELRAQYLEGQLEALSIKAPALKAPATGTGG
jgi:acyl-CoA synthetase (AMP-forming)/AMP-acid ligase II